MEKEKKDFFAPGRFWRILKNRPASPTTFAFASVFNLLLWLCPHLNMWETSGLYGLTCMKSWDYSIPEAASWTKIKSTSQLTSNLIISMFNKLSCSWQNNYLYFYWENFSHFTSKGFLFHLIKKKTVQSLPENISKNYKYLFSGGGDKKERITLLKINY